MGQQVVVVAVCLAAAACGGGRDELATATQAVTTCVTIQRGTAGSVADAMLSNPPAANNFGTHPIARVGGKDEGLFRFDLVGIPSSAAINSATLTLYVNGDASNTPLAIHRATTAWTESAVSFASFGQSFDLSTSALINPTSANAFKSVDVTTLVQGWVGGTQPNHGLVIETASQKKTIFVSSEGTVVAQRPALRVCYTTNDNYCEAAPCQHGGTCTNGSNGYSCACPAGYDGTNCEHEIDNCSTHPCQNGGVCSSSPGGYACACPPGFGGDNCETNIDECAANPCGHGVCADGVNAYSCTCDVGYSGAHCEIEIDDCAGAPCRNGGSCTDLLNAYVCVCAAGYEGDYCEVEIDHCNPNLCENGATCLSQPTGFSCSCAPGYTGVTCSDEINECASAPCLNGGACADGLNSYTCQCATGYAGANCESDINDCTANACNGHGLCIDGVASFSCQCAGPYSGATCTTIRPADLCAFNGQQVTQIGGGYTITNAASLSSISCVSRIGSLTINADSSIGAIDLPVLESVGSLTITSTSHATAIKLGGLSQVTESIAVEGNPFVEHVDLDALTQVKNVYVIGNPTLQRFATGAITTANAIQYRNNAELASVGLVGLGSMTSLVGDLYVNDNPKLASLGANGLSSLVTARGVYIYGNALLAGLGPTSLQAFTGTTGEFVIQQNPLLTVVDVRNARLASLWIVSNASLTTLNLGNLPAQMLYIVIGNQPLLTSIGPTGFSTVETVVDNIDIQNTNLSALDFASLKTVGANAIIHRQPLLTLLNLGSLESVGAKGTGIGYFQISNSPLLTSVDLEAVTLGGLYATGNTALTSLRVGTFRNHVSYAVIQGSPNLTSLGPNGLSSLVHVDATFALFDSKLATIDLANLRTVWANFQIVRNSELTTLGSLTNLVSQGEGHNGNYVEIVGNPKLLAVDLGAARIGGWYIAGNAQLSAFRLNSSRERVSYAVIDQNPNLADIGPVGYSNLRNVDFALSFGNSLLTSLGPTGLSNLITVGGDMVVIAPQVSSFGPTSLASLTSVAGLFEIERTQVAAIDVSHAALGGLYIVDNAALTELLIGVPRTSMTYVVLTRNPLLETLGTAGVSSLVQVTVGGILVDRTSLSSFGPTGLSNLQTVKGGFGVIRSLFTSISLPALTTVPGDFEFVANPTLTSVSAPLLTKVGNWLWMDANPLLSSVSVGALTTLGNLLVKSNPQLPFCQSSLLAQLVGFAGQIVVGGNAAPVCP